MKNNTNRAGGGILLIICLVFIVGLICSAEPKCSMSGCRNDAKEDSSYCYLHDLSNQVYGNPDYHEVYENSKKNREKASSSSSGSNKSSSDATTNKNKATTSSKKTYSTYDSYDEGYEDMYDNDDFDWERYHSDDDYAAGVDDAMDEIGW